MSESIDQCEPAASRHEFSLDEAIFVAELAYQQRPSEFSEAPHIWHCRRVMCVVDPSHSKRFEMAALLCDGVKDGYINSLELQDNGIEPATLDLIADINLDLPETPEGRYIKALKTLDWMNEVKESNSPTAVKDVLMHVLVKEMDELIDKGVYKVTGRSLEHAAAQLRGIRSGSRKNLY